jgi:hypothetical protein
MGEVGILHEDARVELIEGEIIDMPPIGSLHAETVAHLLRQACGEQALVATQNPVFLDPYSEPQPNITLLRPRADFLPYLAPHPCRCAPDRRSGRHLARLRYANQAPALRPAWHPGSLAG